MNILIEGINLENYYSKEHESFKNGLRTMYGAKVWGKGYENYDPEVDSFLEIRRRTFGDEEIDLLIIMGANNYGFKDGIGASYNVEKAEEGFYYRDLEKLKCKKAVLLYDFWSEAECKREEYFDFILKNQIDIIFTLFRYPLHIWRLYPDIIDRMIWLPPSFNPGIFNDWGMEKKYDVGNLNSGIFSADSFYPERHKMHKKLLEMNDITYLYSKHPGGGFHKEGAPLIGKNFSKAINECRIFVTSGHEVYKNFTSKYVEIMASKACLFTTECLDEDVIGLIDGWNCIKISESNFEDKVHYFLKHKDELKAISERGYRLVMEKYNCYAQANYVYRNITR